MGDALVVVLSSNAGFPSPEENREAQEITRLALYLISEIFTSYVGTGHGACDYVGIGSMHCETNTKQEQVSAR